MVLACSARPSLARSVARVKARPCTGVLATALQFRGCGAPAPSPGGHGQSESRSRGPLCSPLSRRVCRDVRLSCALLCSVADGSATGCDIRSLLSDDPSMAPWAQWLADLSWRANAEFCVRLRPMRHQNRLLAALSEADGALLGPHLEAIDLPLGHVLVEPAAEIRTRSSSTPACVPWCRRSTRAGASRSAWWAATAWRRRRCCWGRTRSRTNFSCRLPVTGTGSRCRRCATR